MQVYLGAVEAYITRLSNESFADIEEVLATLNPKPQLNPLTLYPNP